MGDDTQDQGLLRSQEELDEDELGDYLDAGYSPAERPLGVNEWGITERESHGHESLSRRLAREVKAGDAVGQDGDGLGDSVDTDGEIIDGEVGAVRSGRLVFWDSGDSNGIVGAGAGDDYWARDVGIDGGAASAEESAVHIVDPGQYGSR